MSQSKLPPDTRIGTVHLRVGDLASQVDFYQEVLGFSLLAEDGATAALGCNEDRPLLVIHAEPGAPARKPGTTGLFHIAFRVPSRADLGAMVHRIQAKGTSIDGFADHNVSEAVYLADPEGNGLELYADRARDVWHSVEGEVFMTTEPLDVQGLLVTAPDPAPRLPAETVVGHMHLRVADLAAAEEFYAGRLGLDVTTRSYPGALFMAAGGYHHHIGLNVWGGKGAPAPEEGSRGLVFFDLIVPSPEARARILEGTDEGTLLDPDHIGVRVARP